MKDSSTIAITVLVGFSMWSCGDSIEPGPNSQSEHSSDEAPPEIRESETVEVIPPLEDENFTKPEEPTAGVRDNDDLWEAPENPALIRTAQTARDHMKHTGRAAQSWLYEDEFFVLDGFRFVRDDHYAVPDTFEVMVFHGGEVLPSRTVRVDNKGEFPSMEEIESWDSDEFTESSQIHIGENEPVNHTTVIPPSSFPEPSAYNIQIALVAQHDDWQGIDHFRSPGFFSLSTSHTVYYESEYYRRGIEGAENLQNQLNRWESTDPNRWVGVHITGLFLAPPRELSNWNDVEDGTDADLGQLIETSEQDIDLDFYFMGKIHPSVSFTHEKNVYYVLKDGELIDSFQFSPGFETDFQIEYERENGWKYNVELSLDEGEHSVVQVLAAPMPTGTAYKRSDDRLDRPRPLFSNALEIQHVPED